MPSLIYNDIQKSDEFYNYDINVTTFYLLYNDNFGALGDKVFTITQATRRKYNGKYRVTFRKTLLQQDNSFNCQVYFV